MFIIRNRESRNCITAVETYEEAKNFAEEYDVEEVKEGTYEYRFYEMMFFDIMRNWGKTK